MVNRLNEGLQRLRNSRKQQEPPSQTSVHVTTSDYSAEWHSLGATIHHSEQGAFIRRVKRYALDHVHGKFTLSQLNEHIQGLSGMLTNQAIPAARDILFLDTETTGLGSGTGNVAFMIGLGYQEQDHFVVDQLFIRNPAEEFAMLDYLQQLLPRFSYLVTYNGKSFDWPIIRNRYMMHRRVLDDRHLHHLDFLHPSRSVWKNTLTTCRLSNVEEQRLGITREDDLPGALAPAIYFQYLTENNASIMDGVFRHNAQDILSLQVLCTYFAMLLDGKIAFERLASSELMRTGLWLDKQGLHPLADQAFAQLLQRSELELTGLHHSLAAVYKRKGDWHTACRLWESSLQVNAGIAASPEPCIELSMIYEHKWKDYERALHYAKTAQQFSMQRLSLSRDHKWRKQLTDVQKRIQRLQKKQHMV